MKLNKITGLESFVVCASMLFRERERERDLALNAWPIIDLLTTL